MKNIIYTIGHSNHSLSYFLELIENNNIKCIVDVRSTPYSSYNPQFNKENMFKSINGNNKYYIPMGKNLGARHKGKALYKDGILDFTKVKGTENFKAGINRLLNGLDKGYKIALMCTEKDPIDCHRSILISKYLREIGFGVNHILEDGSIESHKELERKLINMYKKKIQSVNMFNPQDDKNILEQAYEKRNMDIGYIINRKIRKES